MGRNSFKRHHSSSSVIDDKDISTNDEIDNSSIALENREVTNINEEPNEKYIATDDSSKDRPDTSSTAGVITKFLTGKLKIDLGKSSLILWIFFVIVITWLFIQDNESGKVDNIEGIGNFSLKFATVLLFCLVIQLAILIVNHSTQHDKKRK